ncbi:flagellar basal-body MS-ring/collar protein FliF [Virgibacillus alimentarius]|uniref:flagellar basal-body MS-ring/collar protein FliF n=1 Tax=Virgibacillus alimentarius TaxID=698769 RepID=UPI00049312A5|nr:flagellar basal-body MS-ring/collar protein FliF [Virgibacillus alimentarius]
MKEKIKSFQNAAKNVWMERTKSQKLIFIGSFLIILIIILAIIFYQSNKKLVPLYNNLSLQEVGQIKDELDTRGITYELEEAGTTITVPEDDVDTLLVDLAGQGLPNSGNIDYSSFSENSSWGVTDNEFNVMKLDAMQTELAYLMKEIDGIEDAKVMINMPEEPVFVSDNSEEASASIVLNTNPGYEFKGNQIDSLYHLVSKAIPNLPAENIVIMNQYFEYFDKNTQNAGGNEDKHSYQQMVKKDIEKDIQKRLQQMLGALVGTEKVIVSVIADVDFTEENRTEELVHPVDMDNMEGLPVSIETVHETYSGTPPVGGTAGTGDEDIPTYQGTEDDPEGQYELDKETVNNEFNRIRKEIIESPYKVRDLGIQVAVDRVKNGDGKAIQYLSQQDQNAVKEGINSILNSVVSTSIDKDYGEIDPEENISIVFQEFSDNQPFSETAHPFIPVWMYVIGAILLIIITILIILLLRNKKKNAEDEPVSETISTETQPEIPRVNVPELDEQPESELIVRRKQLEKMAKEKPEEFAKLLRSWISEE